MLLVSDSKGFVPFTPFRACFAKTFFRVSLVKKNAPILLGAFGVLSLYEPVHVHLTTTNVPLPLYWYKYYCWHHD